MRDWIEEYDGIPANREGEPVELTIDFGERKNSNELSWKEFFDIFQKENLVMVYEMEDKVENDGRSPSEKYDFEHEKRNTGPLYPETEMDDPQVRQNTEETV